MSSKLRTATFLYAKLLDVTAAPNTKHFLLIEPNATKVERPVVKLHDDQDKAFGGKTLIIPKVPIPRDVSFLWGILPR
jgi:hypothetical protein